MSGCDLVVGAAVRYSACAVKNIRFVFLAPAAVAILVACATSADDPSTAVPAADAGKDAKAITTDGGGNSKDGGGSSTCSAQCQTDLDCQSSCGTPPAGIFCCDTLTATCFTVADSVCPEPPDAATGG